MENKKVSVSLVLLIVALLVIAMMAYFLYEAYNKIADSKDKKEENIVALNEDEEEQEVIEENDENEIIDNSVKSDEVETNAEYAELKKELGKDEVLYVTDVKKNKNGTYTLKGTVYTKLTMTKDELEDIVAKGSYKYRGENLKVINSNGDKGNAYEFHGNWSGQERVYYVAVKKSKDVYYIENTTENSNEWKMTKKHVSITLGKDLNVEDDNENGDSTVESKFKDFKKVKDEESYPPTPAYTFEFKDGKCTKVLEYLLGY